MTEANTARRPWHLWVVGILGGLWSVIGLMSLMVTQLNVEAVMSGFPPEQRAYFDSFPLWADGLWGVGVFGGVIGCVALLLRNRLAFPLLVLSAIGAIGSNLGGLFLLGGYEVMGKTDGLGFSMIPIGFGVGMAYYAGAMRHKGMLR
ncbi:MAG: hypothetical protein P3A28_00815 [Gemmatimonadota bacterium]|nr:hypothetical protein [Gemmatimonadota bacterium]